MTYEFLPGEIWIQELENGDAKIERVAGDGSFVATPYVPRAQRVDAARSLLFGTDHRYVSREMLFHEQEVFDCARQVVDAYMLHPDFDPENEADVTFGLRKALDALDATNEVMENA